MSTKAHRTDCRLYHGMENAVCIAISEDLRLYLSAGGAKPSVQWAETCVRKEKE